jgi:predicted DsbA family dithiol-disulfide isomerase
MSDLRHYAKQIGLDVDQFWDDVRSRKFAERIAEDVEIADQSLVTGTPSFFIDGRRYEGAYDIETLSQLVKRALANRAAPA